jgi:hypothetical protein
MMESVEMLERIGNGNEPPLDLEELQGIQEQLMEADSNKKELHKRLAGMKKAFQARGDFKEWDSEVLDKIDDCFVRHFMPSGQTSPVAFGPGNIAGINKFIKYYNEVDEILRLNAARLPEYVREYFAYYAMWEQQGFEFPMPLGTRSVIYCVHLLLKDYEKGFQEVSRQYLRHWTADRIKPYARAILASL